MSLDLTGVGLGERSDGNRGLPQAYRGLPRPTSVKRKMKDQVPVQRVPGVDHVPPQAHQEPVQGMRGITDMRA